MLAVPRAVLLASSVLGALSNALPPVVAVLFLDVGDYGAFSVAYLVFAWGWSITLSAICETWARVRSGRVDDWPRYSPALVQLSLIGAAAGTFAGALAYEQPWLAVPTGAAVGLTMYRLGARYHHSVVRGPHAVLASDAVGVLVFGTVLGATVLSSPGNALLALVLSWVTSALAGAAFFRPTSVAGGGGLRGWYRRKGGTVRPLLGESLLMDAGSVGTPMVLAPLLGLADFGVYRSVSSVSLPVQLLMDPIRPNISQTRPALMLGGPVTAVVHVVAVLLSVACYAAFLWVLPVLFAFSPVLLALSEFALACSAFVGVAFLGYFYYILARVHLQHSRLLLGRVVQTVFAIALPVVGFALAGLSGAIWGFVVNAAVTAIVWTMLIFRDRARIVGAGRDAPAQRPVPGAGGGRT